MLRYLPASLELIGLSLVSAAAFLVSLPLGLLVSGLSLSALGVAIDRLTGSPE